jgi:hypothetical protein
LISDPFHLILIHSRRNSTKKLKHTFLHEK